MRCCSALLAILIAAIVWRTDVSGQSPTYGLGRAPSDREVSAWDTAVGPDGKELPSGSGTAKDGARIFEIRGCAGCHGPTGVEGPAPRLVGGVGTIGTEKQIRTVGSYWPFATTIWDFINRAMPLNQGGFLSADEVYALTAFLLHRNGIIQETDVMDATTLPTVRMPNRDGFRPPPISEWKPGMPRPFKSGGSR
jgi:cytochrome c